MNSSETFKSNKNKIADINEFKEEAYREEPPANPGQVIKGGGRVQYPLGMTDAQDKIRFTAVEIVAGEKSTYVKKDTSIYIAVQAPIQDTNTVKWGESTQNAIQEQTMEAARALVNADKSALAKLSTQVAETMKESSGEFSEYSRARCRSSRWVFKINKKNTKSKLRTFISRTPIKVFSDVIQNECKRCSRSGSCKGNDKIF